MFLGLAAIQPAAYDHDLLQTPNSPACVLAIASDTIYANLHIPYLETSQYITMLKSTWYILNGQEVPMELANEQIL